MKVLHLTDRLSAGGVSNVILDLTARRPKTWDVKIGVLSEGEWDARVTGVQLLRGWREVLAGIRDADVIHAHQRSLGLLAFALRGRAILIDHVHNMFSDRRFLSFRGGVVVAVSTDVANNLERHYSRLRGRVQVIQNGVPDLGEAKRASLGSLPRSLVGVGRLETQKNPQYFLELCERINQQEPISALWVGSGSLEREFLEMRYRLGLHSVVRWVPTMTREEVATHMASASALIVTSRWEGLPLVALEAFAMGLPVATTDCGDIAKVVSGADAGVILTSDPMADSRLVLDLLGPLNWSSASASGRVLFERDYLIDKTIDKWGAVYEHIHSQP